MTFPSTLKDELYRVLRLRSAWIAVGFLALIVGTLRYESECVTGEIGDNIGCIAYSFPWASLIFLGTCVIFLGTLILIRKRQWQIASLVATISLAGACIKGWVFPLIATLLFPLTSIDYLLRSAIPNDTDDRLTTALIIALWIPLLLLLYRLPKIRSNQTIGLLFLVILVLLASSVRSCTIESPMAF